MDSKFGAFKMKVFDDGIIQCETGDHLGRIAREVISTKDAATRECLIKLGWTPPDSQPQQWIKCSDRLPVEKDGDYKDRVWVCELGDRDPFVWSLKTLVEYKRSHPEYEFWWTPTNLKLPEPPKE